MAAHRFEMKPLNNILYVEGRISMNELIIDRVTNTIYYRRNHTKEIWYCPSNKDVHVYDNWSKVADDIGQLAILLK